MQGPIPARILPGSAPSAAICIMVASTTPASAPRQPACAAPITRAIGSWSRTGAQSAAKMPSATPGTRETMPSARGESSRRQGSSTMTTTALWICRQVTSRSADRSSRSSAIARLRATFSAGSPEPNPQLSDPNRPWLTPPRRVKKACRTAPFASSTSRAIIAAFPQIRNRRASAATARREPRP